MPCHQRCTQRTSIVVKKNFFSFPVAVNNSIKVGPLVFLFINVCNHGEHYETPCIKFYFWEPFAAIFVQSNYRNSTARQLKNMQIGDSFCTAANLGSQWVYVLADRVMRGESHYKVVQLA